MRDQIAISHFLRESKHLPSGFKSAYPTEEGLIEAVAKNFHLNHRGYREGVILVPIPPLFMLTPVVLKTPDMKLVTTLECRVPGEPPRQRTVATVEQLPIARSASAVLYHWEVLAEDNDRTSDKPWEVVTVLAHAGTEPEPMTVGTLLANHFHEEGDGGTNTQMSPEEFEEAMGRSYRFWRDYCMAEEPSMP